MQEKGSKCGPDSPADYGATSGTPMSGTAFEQVQDPVAVIGGIASILACCLVLPYMIYGVVLAILSGGVPHTCNSSLHAVFLGLGLTYVVTTLLLGFALSCGARNVVEAFGHLIAETRYDKEGCDDEADIEAAEAKRSFFKTFWLCPCCFLAAEAEAEVPTSPTSPALPVVPETGELPHWKKEEGRFKVEGTASAEDPEAARRQAKLQREGRCGPLRGLCGRGGGSRRGARRRRLAERRGKPREGRQGGGRRCQDRFSSPCQALRARRSTEVRGRNSGPGRHVPDFGGAGTHSSHSEFAERDAVGRLDTGLQGSLGPQSAARVQAPQAKLEGTYPSGCIPRSQWASRRGGGACCFTGEDR